LLATGGTHGRRRDGGVGAGVQALEGARRAHGDSLRDAAPGSSPRGGCPAWGGGGCQDPPPQVVGVREARVGGAPPPPPPPPPPGGPKKKASGRRISEVFPWAPAGTGTKRQRRSGPVHRAPAPSWHVEPRLFNATPDVTNKKKTGGTGLRPAWAGGYTLGTLSFHGVTKRSRLPRRGGPGAECSSRLLLRFLRVPKPKKRGKGGGKRRAFGPLSGQAVSPTPPHGGRGSAPPDGGHAGGTSGGGFFLGRLIA